MMLHGIMSDMINEKEIEKKEMFHCVLLKKDADPTASLGNLFQCYQTDLKQMKKVFCALTGYV